MMRRAQLATSRIAAFATLAVIAAGCGGGERKSGASKAATTPRTELAVTVTLEQEAGSGQSGKATLTAAEGNSMSVAIEITPSKKHSYHPAHIHKGTCADYRKLKGFEAQLASVVDELQDVTEGRSESTVYTSLAARTTGAYSINVHAPIQGYKVVACGDIPKR